MIGVVMSLQNAAQAARRESLGEVGQAAVDQPALIAAFDQRAARQPPKTLIDQCQLTGRALAAVNRHLPGVTGAQQGQAHACSRAMRWINCSTLCASAPELS